MEVSGYPPNLIPNLYDKGEGTREASLQAGNLPGSRLFNDLLEISPTARELATDAIEHGVAHYYGTMEINDSLQSVLSGKPPEVVKAAYTIIQANMFPDGSVSDEGERAALIETGLSQAKFLADRYMTDDEKVEFLSTMNQIAVIAQTRKVDPETGQASYVHIPQKPKGAPSDYVNAAELMKRFEPETYEQYRGAIATGGDGLSTLLQFAKKIPQHNEWVTTYRAEVDTLMKGLQDTKIENRFAGVDSSSLNAFLADMNSKFMQTSFGNKDFLLNNMLHFARILG